MKRLLVFLLLCTPAYGQVLSNRPASSSVEYDFTSRTTTGAPTAIVGGAVACKKNASATTSTAGVTFTANLGVTAANHLTVNLAADTAFYAATSQIGCYFTAGTVAGTSIAGEYVVQFYISADATIQKGVAFPNFPVWMRTASNAAVTGIFPACIIQKDSGAFTGTTNSVIEVGNGKYRVDLTSTETAANALSLICTGGTASAYIVNVTPQQ